jgi:hypothetical protein
MPPKFPSEPPTNPDLRRFACPECAGVGSVDSTDEAGLPTKRGCDACFGKKWLDRQGYDRWRKSRNVDGE